jgi:hypothetical protein
MTDTTAITASNMYYNHIYGTPGGVRMGFDPVMSMVDDPDQLIATLNLHLAANQFSALTVTNLKAAYNALPSNTSAVNKIRAMVHLAMSIPEAAIQR